MRNKTRFEYRGIMQQIMDWQEAYIREFGSVPTVVEIDKFTKKELARVALDFNHIIPDCFDAESVMGMQIVVAP